MPSKKIIIAWIGLILSVSGGYYFYTQSSVTKSNTSTPRVITVSTGSISETIKATGNISAFEESTLSFWREGIVGALYKKEWDPVKAGELIGEISAWTAELDMESAKRGLSDAQAAYDELFDSAEESDISKAKSTLEESESAMKLLEQEYESLITNQKNTLKDAQENLEILKKKSELAESEYKYTQWSIVSTDKVDNLEKDVESAWILIEETSRIFPDIVESIENITGMNNKISEYYWDLGSKDMTLKSKTDALYTEIIGKLAKYQLKIVEIRNSNTQNNFDTVYTELQNTKEIINNLNNLSNLVLQEFIYTPSWRSWSSDKIKSSTDTVESTIATLANKQNSVNSSLVTLKAYGSDELQDLADKNSLKSKEQTMESAKNAVIKAERDLITLKGDQEIKKISAQNNLEKQKNSIQQNKYAYQDIIDGPSSTEVRNAESKVASANISLKRAKEWMKDYQITASFDGTVEDIPWTVGETAETTKWVLIANKNTYKIELSLDQIDIVKIKEWMPAVVTLDAYAWKEFTGSVIAISATPTITSGVVSYTATVWVNIEWVNVMSSMSTSVSIIVSSGTDNILIPSWAVISRWWKSYITLTKWERWVPGITEEREVTLGKTMDGKIEVLTWLTIWEKILYTPVSIQWITTSGSTIRSNNQMMRGSMWWGTNWPPPGF